MDGDRAPGWRWNVIADLIRDIDPRIGAEVGVRSGRFTGNMLRLFPALTMITVDPWENQPGANEDYNGTDWARVYADYRQRIDPARVVEHVMYSVDAAQLVDDASLDFVFLDAQHDYQSIRADIKAWRSKVRHGGLLCGHDWHPRKFPGVVKAVTELLPRARISDSDSVWFLWNV